MKKVLSLILVMFFVVVASAQTRVFDTTIVKTPLGVTVTGGGVKDSLFIQAATTSQNGYMSSTSMQQLASLMAGAPSYPTPNTQSSGVYTLQASDFNKIVIMTSGSTSTIVLPTGLTPGWSCRVLQAGGVISFAASTGVTINSIFNYRRSQTQWGVITVICTGSNTFSLSGNLKL
jgi:hypothetical protein